MNQEHAMTDRPHPVRTTTLHRLRRHQALSLRRPQGLCVRAERGSLWVTVDGDLADIELSPGDSQVFNGPATVVVSTLGGDAVASITATLAPAWTQRLQGWLHSSVRRVPA
jgi:glucose/arabinose dehydrogenase